MPISSIEMSVCARRAVALAAVLLLLTSMRSAGQDVTEVALKAAFIYNFAKFTEWPTDVLAASAPIAACVYGDQAVADALSRTVRGRQAGGHDIDVSLVTSTSDALKMCHLLYVSGVPAGQASEVAAALKASPVLTISDLDKFATTGGIAQFFVENGKMRFAINLGAARRARLQLSSRLLALAVVLEPAGQVLDSSPMKLNGMQP